MQWPWHQLQDAGPQAQHLRTLMHVDRMFAETKEGKTRGPWEQTAGVHSCERKGPFLSAIQHPQDRAASGRGKPDTSLS